MKEAKLNDMGVTQNRDVAKKYISGHFDTSGIWDRKIEFDPDSYYEPGWDGDANHRPRV